MSLWLGSVTAMFRSSRLVNRRMSRLRVEELGPRIVPAVVIWEGSISSTASLAANWQGGVLPGGGDTIAFNGSAGANCTIDAAFAASVTSLRIEDAYTGKVTIGRDFEVTGFALIEADTKIDATKTLTVHDLTCAGAVVEGPGNLLLSRALPAPGVLSVDGVDFKDLTFTVDQTGWFNINGTFNAIRTKITNQGAISWNAGDFQLDGVGAELTNNANATVYVSCDNALFGMGSKIDNYGLWYKGVGAENEWTSILVAFNNLRPLGGGPGGTVQLAVGTMRLVENGTHNSAFDLAADTELMFSTNTQTFQTGAVFNGTGTITIRSNAKWDVQAGVEMLVTPKVNFLRGSLLGAGQITVNGDFTWERGDITDLGALTLKGNNSFAGDFTKTFNNSNMFLIGPTIVDGEGDLTFNGGTVLNLNTFDIRNDKPIQSGLALTLFPNGRTPTAHGVVTKTQGIENEINVDFLNEGGEVRLNGKKLTFTQDLIQIGAGSVIQLDGGTLAFDAGKRLIIRPGTTVRGTGTIDGDFILEGILDFGQTVGTLVVTGNFTMFGSAVLKMKLGGALAGQYDWLDCRQSVALGGRVEVSLTNGFNPAPGHSFVLITATTGMTGQPASMDLPLGPTWTVHLNPFDLTLTAH